MIDINKYFDKIQRVNKLPFLDILEHKEASKYFGLEYSYNKKYIIQRTSKLTPKKLGQFVTLWTRNSKGIMCPYQENSLVDYVYIITEENNGCFKFPKDELINRGIFSSKTSPGKRGFRVYPPWDKPTSKQAISTQKWQGHYFFDNFIISEDINELK